VDQITDIVGVFRSFLKLETTV